MAIDLLSYTGNAALGLSTNTNIPVASEGLPTQGVNQFIRDAMAMDEQRNMLQWKQKINDRDNMMKLIAEDQFPAGDVLPEYMPDIEAAREAQIKAFDKWRGNPNDLKGFAEYKRASQKAKDTAKMAQINTTGIRELDQLAAQEEIPEYAGEVKEFRGRQLKKGLSDVIDPFQKTLRLNTVELRDSSLKGAISDGTIKTPTELATTQKTTVTNAGGRLKETQTTTTAPVKGGKTQKVIPSVGMQSVGAPGVSKTADTFYDYDRVYANTIQDYATNPKMREYQNLLTGYVSRIPPQRAKEFIDSINKRLSDYNTQRGLAPGQQGYAKPMEIGTDVVVDPNGQLQVALPAPEFAAKAMLADVDGDYFQPGQEVFNKDMADFWLKNQKLKLDAEKLGLDRSKAKAYIDNVRARTKKLMDSGVSEEDVTTVANQFTDDFSIGNVIERTTTVDGKSTKSVVGDANVFYIDKIPTGYQNVIGPVYDIKGKLTTKSLEPFVNSVGGRPYLKGKIYNADGTEVKSDAKSIRQAYNDSRKAGFGGTYDDYKTFVESSFRDDIRSGRKNVIMVDANGNKITPNSIKDAFKLINNQTTKKGQPQLFEEETITETEEE